MDPYQRLEVEFSRWLDMPADVAVACSSGSAALHLALEAFRLPPLSEVIVPEFTMIACARAVTLAGLKPVFVDCNENLTLDEDHLKRKLTKNTRAIMAVHIYGRICDMDHIQRLAEKRDIYVIEDCAESHGARNDYVADASCYSFYKNKIIHGEEGGMVLFNKPEHADLAKQLRSHGFTEDHDFLHTPRGWNYRLSNAHAHLILKSLNEVADNLAARKQIEQWYATYIPSLWQMPPRRVCWVYDVQLQGINTRDVVRSLNEQGIGARLAFKPMSEQSEYRNIKELKSLCAYYMSRKVIYLPVVPGMSEGDVAKICELLNQAVISAGTLVPD